jgi:transposase-like protein
MLNPFRYFNSSPEVIHLAVMMYIRYPLSLRQVEDILFERGIDICHETVRFWWDRFGPLFAAAIRKDKETTHSSPVVFAMALAPRRSVRQDQWRDALSLACGGPRRRGA